MKTEAELDDAMRLMYLSIAIMQKTKRHQDDERLINLAITTADVIAWTLEMPSHVASLIHNLRTDPRLTELRQHVTLAPDRLGPILRTKTEIHATLEMMKCDLYAMMAELKGLDREDLSPNDRGAAGLLTGIVDALSWVLGNSNTTIDRRIKDGMPGKQQ